jgi:hypothetical protein
LNSDDSESEEQEDSDNENNVKGGDVLMADEMDIPRVDDIPIVSKLAKEKNT